MFTQSTQQVQAQQATEWLVDEMTNEEKISILEDRINALQAQSAEYATRTKPGFAPLIFELETQITALQSIKATLNQ